MADDISKLALALAASHWIEAGERQEGWGNLIGAHYNFSTVLAGTHVRGGTKISGAMQAEMKANIERIEKRMTPAQVDEAISYRKRKEALRRLEEGSKPPTY